MKVVHLGTGYTPVPPGDKSAGREEYTYQLTNHLGRLGCQVHVIDIKGGAQQKEKRQESSATFHEAWHLPPRRYNFPFWERFLSYLFGTSPVVFFALSSSPVLYRLLSREKIEVIHAHDSYVALSTIIVNKLKRNTAVTAYTPQVVDVRMKFSRRKKVIHLAEILALKWADHIIALTPAVKDWLVSELNLDPAKITYIGVGVAVDEIEKFLCGKAGACHQSNMVLCVGGISGIKNQFTAVKAVSQVIRVHPETKLVFAGPLWEVNYFNLIQRFIAENNLSSYVEFKGEVTRQELYNLYSDAIVFLFPTTAEVRPAVLIEALGFGLPVVSSTIKPIMDVVGEKGCAILVDPYDVDGLAAAIIRVLDDSSLRQSMSHRAKELAQTFSYEYIAAQTLALYNELVQHKKQSPR